MKEAWVVRCLSKLPKLRCSRTVLLLLTAFLTLQVMGQAQKPPKGFENVRVCGIEMILPKDFKAQKTRSIDSCLAKYNGKTGGIWLDYGVYGGDPSLREEKAGSQREKITVDGKKGDLRYSESSGRFRYEAEIYVQVREPPADRRWGGVSLVMVISLPSKAEASLARKILESIRFPPE